MPTPRSSSYLVDEPAPPAGSSAPRARTVLILGPAGRGPTNTPVPVEDASRAYEVFGRRGPLSDAVAEALYGARLGGEASGSGVYGNVVAIRTETGSRASRMLTGANGMDQVMKLETAASGDGANNWRIWETASGYRVEDPEAPQSERFTDFTVTPGSDRGISSPSELVSAINDQFGGRLQASIETGEERFEIRVNEADLSSLGAATSNVTTEIDFSDVSVSDMAALASGQATWIGGEADYFGRQRAQAVHNRVIASGAEDVSIYSITAGGFFEAPQGSAHVQVDSLADAKRLSGGDVNSLLNVRTVGSGDGTRVTIESTGERLGSRASEGYLRARDSYLGRIYFSQSEKAVGGSTQDVDQIETDDVDLDDPGLGTSEGDRVLLVGQRRPSENGIYTADSSGGLRLTTGREALAEERVTASGNAKMYSFSPSEGRIIESQDLVVKFEAPEGIADDGGALASEFALSRGLSEADAGLVSSDRQRKQLQQFFGIKIAPSFDQDDVRELESVPAAESDGADSITEEGLITLVGWESGGSAWVKIDRTYAEAQFGEGLDGAFLYADYDSCVFELQEKKTKGQLSKDAPGRQFYVEGDEIWFNRPLEENGVFRSLRVNQYDLRNDVTVERTPAGGNRFTFHGQGNQPGEGGGAIGDVETILGFRYEFEPELPKIPQTNGLSLQGGSSGLGARPERKVAALREALASNMDQDYFALVPAGLHVDDTKSVKDQMLGTRKEEPLGLLELLKDHQDEQDDTGSSGIVMLPVRAAERDANGRHSREVLRARVSELVDQSATDISAANIIQSENWKEFFFFDAPSRVTIGGVSRISTSVALFAGLRSGMRNDQALYNVTIPGVEPVYRYPRASWTSALSDARINAWDHRRGTQRLADERTGAGFLLDASGVTQPSGFQSALALLPAKDFQKKAERELDTLLGGIGASGGIDMLKAKTVTLLRGVRDRTTGVQQIIIDPQKDIRVNPAGGGALSMSVNVEVVSGGELRQITLAVSHSTAGTQGQENQGIEVAR